MPRTPSELRTAASINAATPLSSKAAGSTSASQKWPASMSSATPWVMDHICIASAWAFFSGAWKWRSTATALCDQFVHGLLRRTAGGRLSQETRVAEHGLVKSGLGLGEGQVGGAASPQRGDRIGAAVVPGAAELLVEIFEPLLRQGCDQRIAVGEVPIGRGAGDADPLRRLGQGEAGRPAFGNQGARRRKQSLAQPAMMIAAPLFALPAAPVRSGAHRAFPALQPPGRATRAAVIAHFPVRGNPGALRP